MDRPLGSGPAVRPRITVAMPVYNAGRHLEAAVGSIVAQTYPDWDLWLVDDGSTDGAVERLTVLGDPRIRVLRDGRNLGLAARLNQVIDRAEGEFFARMDGDDIAHPERFARQVDALLRHVDVDLVATRCATISESGQAVGRLPFASTHADICRAPWMGFHLPHPTWMGRTAWFRAHRYADPAPYCCEDQELLLRAYRDSTFMALPEELLSYRHRDRIAWKKAWRTRATLCSVQVRHFAARREYGRMALALVVRVVRHLKDMKTWLRTV